MPVLRARIGGVWTDIGGPAPVVPDEVFVGPNEPTDSAVELWVDSDDPNLSDPNTARWNSAWGIVGRATMTGTSVVVSGSVGAGTRYLLGSSFSCLTVAGRRYRLVGRVRAIDASLTAGLMMLEVMRDGSVASAGLTEGYGRMVGPYWTLQAEGLLDGDGATHTFQMQARAEYTATMYIDGISSHCYIEDVGPVALASSPPAQPASVWTNLTLLNGYTHRSGSPGQYRLLGDMVQFRGRIIGTATVSPLFVMPVGFRPISGPIVSLATIVSGAWAHGLLYIDPTSGEAQMQSNGHSELTLNEVTYSVSA